MFGMSSLEELPELPKYKLDENQQLVIDDIIPSEDQSTIEKEEIASDETISEAPMPERENVDVIKNDNIQTKIKEQLKNTDCYLRKGLWEPEKPKFIM